jgi:hypothetical protein
VEEPMKITESDLEEQKEYQTQQEVYPKQN